MRMRRSAYGGVQREENSMTISPDVEAFLTDPIGEPYEKQPGQWRRRGKDGPPLVTNLDGDLVKSGVRKGLPKYVTYGRPSSRGKLIENTYNLAKWGERMAMWGIVAEPEIALDADRIDHEVDTAEWRRAMDTIVVRAKDAAQAMIAAHRGTHVHILTEDDDEDHRWVNRLLAGEDLGISTAAQKALVQAWRRMLAVHGFEILAVEAAVVCDRWRLAGTLDRIVRLTRDLEFVTSSGEMITLTAGTVLVLDLKTGKMTLDRGAIRYWHSYAIQVAAYALGVPYDVDAETRGAWPFEVSREWAIIAHLDVLGAIQEGEARCSLVLCDVDAGIAAGDLCMQAIDWGRNDAVFSPPTANPNMVVALPVAAPRPATDDDFDRVNGEPCLITEATSSMESESADAVSNVTTSTAAPNLPNVQELTRRQAILARLTALPDAQKARIKERWPEGLPSLKSDHQHTEAELDVIEALIEQHTQPRQFERDMATLARPKENESCPEPSATANSAAIGSASTASSGDQPPTTMASPPTDPAIATATNTDEGHLVSDAEVAKLREEFEALDVAEKLWLSVIGQQCKRAGYPLNLDMGPTRRRWSIGTALIRLACLGVGSNKSDEHEQTVRALLGIVMGEEIQPAVVTGSAVAKLTIDEAERLIALAEAMNGPDAEVSFTTEDELLVHGPAVDAARRVA